MKRIKGSHTDKDRIVCVSIPGWHEFFYQPEGTKERYWLFDKPFHGTIFHYFRKYGRNMAERGFSLTIGELYRFKAHRNRTLSHLMDRLVSQTDWLIREKLSAPHQAMAGLPEAESCKPAAKTTENDMAA